MRAPVVCEEVVSCVKMLDSENVCVKPQRAFVMQRFGNRVWVDNYAFFGFSNAHGGESHSAEALDWDF